MWNYEPHHRAWFPDVKCRCGMIMWALITTVEAEKSLEVAQQIGWVSPKLFQELSRYCEEISK